MRGFEFSGVAKMTSPPLVFVGRGGVTRAFGILELRMWAVLVSRVDLREGGLFEVKVLVCLLRDLVFGWGDLLPGGSLGDVEDVGRSPGEIYEEESEVEGSSEEEVVDQSEVIEDYLEERGWSEDSWPGGSGLLGFFPCSAQIVLIVWIGIIDGVLVIIEKE